MTSMQRRARLFAAGAAVLGSLGFWSQCRADTGPSENENAALPAYVPVHYINKSSCPLVVLPLYANYRDDAHTEDAANPYAAFKDGILSPSDGKNFLRFCTGMVLKPRSSALNQVMPVNQWKTGGFYVYLPNKTKGLKDKVKGEIWFDTTQEGIRGSNTYDVRFTSASASSTPSASAKEDNKTRIPFSQLDFSNTSGGYLVYTTLTADTPAGETLTTAVYPNYLCGVGDNPQTELTFRVCPVFEGDEDDSQDLQQGAGARCTMPGQDLDAAYIEVPYYGPCGARAPWMMKLKMPIGGLQGLQCCAGLAQPLPDVEAFDDCACSHPASSGTGCSTALKKYPLGDRKLKGIYVLIKNRAEKDNPGSAACCCG